MDFVTQIIIFLIGISLLIWSADRFVFGAAVIAKIYNVPNILIGLTLVAIGTSAPELFISISSTINHGELLALGDAIGSNIANIGLVSSSIILLKPEILHKKMHSSMVILFLISTILSILVYFDRFLSIYDSMFLFVLFVMILAYKIHFHMYQSEPLTLEIEAHSEILPSAKVSIMWIIIGIVVLPLSAHLTVSSAKEIAHFFNISDFIIGVFLVAIGTSLPEVATTIISILKNQDDIAFGNIIGSNIFNLTIVIVPLGLFKDIAIPEYVIKWDLPYLLGISILYACIIGISHKYLLRAKGLILLILYITYIVITFCFGDMVGHV